jgi:hypothetical protein
MALSDQLSQLAARAKELEDNAAASRQKEKGALEQDVKSARDSAQAQAESLRKSAEARKGQISAWWDNLQRSWNDNIASIRKDVDDRKAEHDAKAAQRKADRGRRRRARHRLRLRGDRRCRVRSARRRAGTWRPMTSPTQHPS